MNLNKIFLDLSEKKYTDAEINLVDQNSSIELSVHKVILGLSSDYFDKLFNFINNKKSHYDIIVNDSRIAYDIILSFYGQSINSTDYPEWKYILETFKCRYFFGLENDANKLASIKFPPEGFNELIKITDELNLLDDKKIIKLIKKNIPDDYDISVFNQDFIKELVNVNINKQYIVSASDCTIKIRDMETGSCLNTLNNHTNSVFSLVLSTDDTKIVSGSADRTIKIWDMETGSCLKTLRGHRGYVNSVVLSSDNTKIVSGSDDNTIKIWDVETGSCLKTLNGHTNTVFSNGHTDTVFSVVLTSDNTRIVSGSRDNTIRIWDMETGSCLNTLNGHTDWVRSVAVTNDNTKIVSGSDDKTIKIWDMDTGSCLKTLSGHTNFVFSALLTTDYTRIVSGSVDKTIKIWDMETGSCLNTLSGHIDSVYSVMLLSDDTKIISGSYDKTIKIWDIETGSCLKTLNGHSNNIYSISLHRNIFSELDKKLMNYSY